MFKIILDALNHIKEIIIKYQKLKGTITVRYVDEDGNDIHEPTIMDNLEVPGEYIIDPIEIEGYKLSEKQ